MGDHVHALEIEDRIVTIAALYENNQESPSYRFPHNNFCKPQPRRSPDHKFSSQSRNALLLLFDHLKVRVLQY